MLLVSTRDCIQKTRTKKQKKKNKKQTNNADNFGRA